MYAPSLKQTSLTYKTYILFVHGQHTSKLKLIIHQLYMLLVGMHHFNIIKYDHIYIYNRNLLFYY
jgi:hypothetical protein